MADILTKCLANKEFNRQLEQIRKQGQLISCKNICMHVEGEEKNYEDEEDG